MKQCGQGAPENVLREQGIRGHELRRRKKKGLKWALIGLIGVIFAVQTAAAAAVVNGDMDDDEGNDIILIDLNCFQICHFYDDIL